MVTSRSRLIHICVFFVLLASGWILPPIGLPPMGMKICGIFIGVMYGWTTIGFLWPSMLGVIILGLSGYAPPNKLIMDAVGSQMGLFLIFVLVFTQYCAKSGLNEYLAKKLLTSRLLLHRPWLFTYVVFFTAFLLGFLVNAAATVFLLSSMLYTVFKDVGYQKKDAYPSYLLAGVCISGVLSFIPKPWFGQNILGISALEKISEGAAVVNYASLIFLTLPVVLLIMLVFVLFMRFGLRLDVSPLMRLTKENLQKMAGDMHATPQVKLAGAAVFFFLFFMLVPNILPAANPIAKFSGLFSLNAGLILILAILSFIRIGGEPVFDFQECSSGIRWSIVWMVAASLPLSAALSSQECGLAELLNGALSGLPVSENPIIFAVAFTIIGSIITQLTHNVTVLLVGVPLIWNLSQVSTINPVGMTIMLIYAAGVAFATPAASTVGALSFGNGEWIGMKRAFVAGIAAWIISMVCVFCVGMPLIIYFIGL